MSAGSIAAKALFSDGAKKTLTSLARGAATGAAIGIGGNFVLNQIQGNTGGYTRAALFGAIAGAGYRGYKMGMPAMKSAYGEIKSIYSNQGMSGIYDAFEEMSAKASKGTKPKMKANRSAKASKGRKPKMKTNKESAWQAFKNKLDNYKSRARAKMHSILRSNADAGRMYGR